MEPEHMKGKQILWDTINKKKNWPIWNILGYPYI